MNHVAVFSSKSNEWSTPQDFFDAWHAEYQFTLDAAATPENAKVDRYFTADDDGLSQDWEGVVWCNPPYGRQIGKWVEKAWTESERGATVVLLIPARTDTTWWHTYVKRAREIHLVEKRLRFGGSKTNAPFPSAVVVFSPGPNPYMPRFYWGGRRC